MTEHISKEMQEKILEFQETQQQARIVLTQKYQLDMQLKETKNAIEELGKLEKTEVHKAIGNILIKAPKEEVLKELKEREETLDIRLKTLEKQEAKLREKLNTLQDRIQGIIPSDGGK